MYRAGSAWRGKEVEVCIVAESVQMTRQGRIVRTQPHPTRPDTHFPFVKLNWMVNPPGGSWGHATGYVTTLVPDSVAASKELFSVAVSMVPLQQ